MRKPVSSVFTVGCWRTPARKAWYAAPTSPCVRRNASCVKAPCVTLTPVSSRRMGGTFRIGTPCTTAMVCRCHHAPSQAMGGGAILIRRHVGVRSPGSLSTGLTAKHLHRVAPNLRLRLGGDIGVADLVHPLKPQLPSAARAAHHRDRHLLRRRRGRAAGRCCATGERPLT